MTTSTLAKRQLPTGIWILGFVSLLMDISSEIIHSLLPIYLVSVLGASALMVGLIEGAAEATAPIVKVFSGALSDYLGKRKGLAVLGYGLGALTKPVFALAPGVGVDSGGPAYRSCRKRHQRCAARRLGGGSRTP